MVLVRAWIMQNLNKYQPNDAYIQMKIRDGLTAEISPWMNITYMAKVTSKPTDALAMSLLEVIAIMISGTLLGLCWVTICC